MTGFLAISGQFALPGYPTVHLLTALQLVNLVIPNLGRRAAAFREHVVTTAVLSTALALAVVVPNVEVRRLTLASCVTPLWSHSCALLNDQLHSHACP